VHTYEQIELRGISQCMNLKSPQLVTIFDVKYGDDGRPWVIMEFVNGPSLRELIDASPSGLGPAKAAFFLREIGKGLTYLHECGIVHRDLKPGNIFYENGFVKIGDYGLSKTMSITRHSGQTVAVGTLHYMAPEIGEGRYDRSIDIYALGALLYEMITGQVPFFGSSPAEVLMKHLTADVNVDEVDEPFRSTIRKAMAKNPADRFQSVQEMVDAIFGSEEIRSSVTQVTPESLTMVAGRVAGRIGSTPPPQYGPRRARNPNENWAERFADRMAEAGDRIRDAGDRFAERMAGAGKKWNKTAAAPYPAGNFSAAQDSMPTAARILLSLMVVFLASFIAMSNTNNGHEPVVLLMVGLGIVGAAIGALLSWQLVMPGVAGESDWVKRLALGAPAAFGSSILSFPFWISSQGRHFSLMAAMEAAFVCLILLQWDLRLSPQRKERFSVGHLFTAGILALVLSGMFDSDPPIVIAIVAGASLAASLLAPWDRSRRGVVTTGGADAAFRVAFNLNAKAAPAAPPAEAVADSTGQTPPPIPQSASTPPGKSKKHSFWRSFAFCALLITFYLFFLQLLGHARNGDASPVWAGILLPTVALLFAFSVMRGNQTKSRAHWFGPAAIAIALICMVALLVPIHSVNGMPVLPILIPALALLFGLFVFRGGSMSTAQASSIPGAPSDSFITLGGVATGLTRFALTATGSALLVFSLLLTIAVVSDLPGLFASGSLDPQMPEKLTQVFGTENWPHLLAEIGIVACFIIGSLSIVLFTLARRSRSALHILRAIAGVLVLFAAAISFGHALPDWADFVPLSTPGATADWYFNHVDAHRALVSVMIALLGYTILFWPAHRAAPKPPPVTESAPK
jgi:hypothetical protein